MFVVTPASGCNHNKGLKLDGVLWTHPHSSPRVSCDQTGQIDKIQTLLFEGTALQSILEFLMILLLPKNDVVQKGAVQKPERCVFFRCFREYDDCLIEMVVVLCWTDSWFLLKPSSLCWGKEVLQIKQQRYLGTTPHNTNTSLHPRELNHIAASQISKKSVSTKNGRVSTTNNIVGKEN